MIEIVNCDLKLPNIRRIYLDKISNEDEYLKLLLNNYFPDEIDYLAINHELNSEVAIQSDFYLESLCNAVKKVKKEVFINCFDFSTESLEKIVKSAFNWEKLVFSFCNIHSDRAWDFSIDSKYKIQHLSFQECGSKQERKTDWKYDSSAFSYIIQGIYNSSLKESLTEINIYDNDSLDSFNIQQEFNVNNMQNISIWKESYYPIFK